MYWVNQEWDASCQGQEPNTAFTNASVLGQTMCITEKAADKDLATLLTAIDYLYSAEGGLLMSCGLSKEQVSMWSTYAKTGNIGSDISGQLTQDQADETNLNTTNIRTYNNQAIPDFVTGRTDISDDAAWQAYCDEVNSYSPETYCDYINAILQ